LAFRFLGQHVADQRPPETPGDFNRYADVVVSSGRMPSDGSQMVVKRMFMRKHLTCMSVGALLMWLGTALLCADGVQTTSDGERDIVSFARTAATQALTFPAGDKAALVHARDVFTEAGWSEFMKVMQGWVDSTGAPTFASAFVASGAGRIVDEQDTIVHVRIPGTLTQTQGHSKTTYRIAADLWITSKPMMVQRLTQTTCRGDGPACR
jgi:hypothetical protein